MTIEYREIVNARLVIEANDATYGVQFDHEIKTGNTWEFDCMSDAVGQKRSVRTGNICVRFSPVKDSMKFPEDNNRQKDYIMDVESARKLWALITNRSPNYWFALDMASYVSKNR